MFGSIWQRIRNACKPQYKRHLPPPKYTILWLEVLEKREMLDANVVEPDAAALMGDAVRVGNDVEKVAIFLINDAQPKSTNNPSPSAEMNQFVGAWTILTTDYSQAWQAFVQVGFDLLSDYIQVADSLIASWYGNVPGQDSSPPPSTIDDDFVLHPRSGPLLGDPPISATEGVAWNGVLATVTDSDADDSQGYLQPDTLTVTINWGDNSSTSYSTSGPEDGSGYISYGHMWQEAGTYTVTITATDSDGGSSQVTDTADVSDGQLNGLGAPNEWGQVFNPLPAVTTPANQTNTEGDNVSLQIQASEGDGDTLSYDALDLPPGLSINPSTGLISGTVAYTDASQFDGDYNPTIIVSDASDGSAQTNFFWTINPAPIAPVLTNPGNQTNLRGDNVALQLGVTQIDNNPLTYSASNLPCGLSIDSETGLISGTVDPSATLVTPYAVTVTASDDTTNLSTSQSFNWTISPANVAPLLTAPGNQSNSAGDKVDLQLSSTDADGDNLTYTATGLPPGLTLDPINGVISGTLPNNAASNTPYNATVTASDGIASSSQSFTWMVHAVSLQNPGDQSNLDGDTVSLQLAAGDANNATLTYSASGLPSGLSINSSTGLISGTIASNADTNNPYSVTVTSTDSNHDSISQSFNWNVARVALNPVKDQENQEGTPVSLQLSATDHEGTPTYSAAGLPPGLSISGTGLISGTVGLGSFGSSPYQVTVTATDGSATSSQSFVWTATRRVALVNPGDQSNATGDSVSLQLSATSPGGTMSYSAIGLPPGLSISNTGLISGSPTTASDTPYNVTVTANDGTSSSSQAFAWTISTLNFVSPGDQTNNDGDTVSLPLTAGYHGSGSLSYTASGLPPGLSIDNSTGLISGTITGDADTNSPYSVAVNVVGGPNEISQSFDWAVNPVAAVDALDDQSNAVGDAVSLQVSASDTLNNTLTYSATNLPAGLVIDSTSGLISGTIALGADSGSPYAATVTATDSAGNSGSQNFNWTVSHVLLVNPGPLQSLDGANVSLQLQGGDADGDTVTYSATRLPTGLSISSSGLISGTIASNADTNSPFDVTLTASDGTNTTTQTFLWTVSQVALTLPSDQTNTEGDNVSLQLQGTASTGSLTYNASNLPLGLSLNPTTGLISGTIASGDAANGPYTVDIANTNGNVSASQSFAWYVNPVVNLTAPADQSNNVGDKVSLQVSATDALNKTLTYSATGLPSGLTINSSTGLISGTITGGDPSGGPYVPSVAATDGTYSSSISFNWNVNDTAALTLTVPGTQDNVSSDSVVNVQATANDPDGDAITYSATNLPDGLSIDPSTGLISGSIADDAATPAPYQTTVTASDGNGQSVSQNFTWIVNAPPIIAEGVPLNLEEGVDPGSFIVATFTTPDLTSLPDDFAAIIDYGDGTTDTGAISGGSGSFTVTADHVYSEIGSYPISIQIINGLTGGSAFAASTATVTDAPLTITGGFQLSDPYDNSPTYYTLATFSDANTNAPLADFSATINWGDGSPVISGPGYVKETPQGTFEVAASHVYPDPWDPPTPDSKLYTVSVTVTDIDGSSAATSSTVEVGEIQAQKPAGMNWSFTDANPYATTSDFVEQGQAGYALVDWGDGASQLVPLTGGPGNGSGPVSFAIQAWHIYADSMDESGQHYKVTVSVADVDGNNLTGYEYVSVVRPYLSLAVGNVDIPANLTVNNAPVAVFTVPDTVDGDGEFTAQIDWGDGNSSSGTIQELEPGLFQVLGSHTYAAYDWYPISVTVSQGWQQQAANAKGAGVAGGKPIITIEDFSNNPTSQLNIGKWETAFRLGNGKTPSGLNNIKLEEYYPYLDHDSFRIKIKDDYMAAVENQFKPITVHVSTSSDPVGHDISIPYYQTSHPNTPPEGPPYFYSVYRSAPLLLVSVPIDDDYPMQGAEGSLTDPTFLAKLGDTVTVTFRGKKGTATVPVKKVVKVHITDLMGKTEHGYAPVASKTLVYAYFTLAKQIYAQAGIKLKLEGGIRLMNEPPGVTLQNGFPWPWNIDTNKSPYMRAVLGLDQRVPKDYIAVYYINYFRLAYAPNVIRVGKSSFNAYDPIYGEAFSGAGNRGAEAKYADSAILAAEDTAKMPDGTEKLSESGLPIFEPMSTEHGGEVLAHEIGHLLLNSPPGEEDHRDPGIFVNRTNLMVFPSILGMYDGTITDARRIDAKQNNAMLSNRPNLLLNP